MTALLGDVELPELPEDYIFMRRCPGGHFSAIACEPGWFRVITSEYDRVAGPRRAVTFEQLRESLVRLAGTDYRHAQPAAGSPGSATPRGRPTGTATAGCCSPATRRTSTTRPAGRG